MNNGQVASAPDTRSERRRFDFLRWKLTSHPARWPSRIPMVAQPPPPSPQGNEIVATWIGHSTFLLQTAQGNFLTDPVFSLRASPVQWAGPRRVHPPGLAFEDLPAIDFVLLSHDHYDHCDLKTLRRLAAVHDPLFLAPQRHADLLTKAGSKRIAELDWWQSHRTASGLDITLTPARHWSNRFGTPRNHRLWGGFFLTLRSSLSLPDATRRIWFAGDTGYDAELFRRIQHRCGAPDLALLPIGAYEPRWFMAPIHMNPAEAVQAHLDAGAHLSIAMHWGTFQLTDEGRDEPVEALVAARAAAGLSNEIFKVLAPGQTISI
jgi:L-ascorbate metabolism protein UlaG (beta-lactamase superfamily)